MFKVSLEKPSWALRDTYAECLREFQQETPSRPVNWDWIENFDRYLEWCRLETRQLDAAGDPAPQNTYWIVVDGRRAVGKLTLRHRLTAPLERIGGHFGYEVMPSFRKKGIASRAFALGLEKIREMGIREVFVTCDHDNLASAGVLEKNGGVLVDTYSLPDWPKPIRKYRFA